MQWALNNDDFCGVLQEILSSRNVCLYGAGIVAYGIAEALDAVWHVHIRAYIVSKPRAEKTYCGKTLLSIEEFSVSMSDALVLIATPEVYHGEIIRELQRKGCRCRYYALGYRLIHDFMRPYYRRAAHLLGMEDLPPCEKTQTRAKTTKIFMAISAKDKPLRNAYPLPQHIRKVQAGAAISARMPEADAYDDTGTNISEKNANYSELTVAYWAWKNQRADYLGICHYRRVLDIRDEEYRKIFAADVDAVLPYPYLCYGDTSFQYGRYISAHDMGILVGVLTHEERGIFTKALRGRYLYNHNLVLAKEKVFHDYCRWMFSVLGRVEAYHAKRGIRRADRYAGYLGEILTSVYFTHRRGELCIAHAPELWMV